MYDKLEIELDENIAEWFNTGLLDYVDDRFMQWVVNILQDDTVEVFISGLEDLDEYELDDELLDETFHLGLEYLKSMGHDDYNTEFLLDYAIERFLVYPLSELGDEPLTAKEGLYYDLGAIN